MNSPKNGKFEGLYLNYRYTYLLIASFLYQIDWWYNVQSPPHSNQLWRFAKYFFATVWTRRTTLLFDVSVAMIMSMRWLRKKRITNYTRHFCRKSGNSILALHCQKLRISCHFKTFLWHYQIKYFYSAICPLQLCMCGATSLETLYRLWICILVAYEQWAYGTSDGEDDATFWPWTSRLQSVFGPAPALDAGKWSQKWAAWACSWGLAWEAAGDNAARHSVANSGLAAKHQSHSVPFCI